MVDEVPATSVPLGKATWQRKAAQEPKIETINRYFESNPTNQVDQVAMIARPGLAYFRTMGDGPIRQIYTQPGTFDEAAFIVSGDALYSLGQDGVPVFIGDGLYMKSKVIMCATGNIGSTPSYLFLADGRNLWVWDGTTWATVATPDDVGISDLCYTSEYVIVVPAQGQGINGRFFWIEPGDITIDPLNFATAERAPDPIIQSLTVGDQFMLLGSNSTEYWYATGDSTAPFQRVQGRTFDQGIWDGTAVIIKDTVVVVGNDGTVYAISGSGPIPVSDPGTSERIRAAMRTQKNRLLA